MSNKVTPAKLVELLDLVSTGIGVTQAAAELGLPERTVWRRLRESDDTWQAYTRAKQASAHCHADKLLEIVDHVRTGRLDPNAARVAADVLKWQAVKLLPAQYGDQVQHTLTAGDGLLQALQAIEAKIKQVPAQPELVVLEHDPAEGG